MTSAYPTPVSCLHFSRLSGDRSELVEKHRGPYRSSPEPASGTSWSLLPQKDLGVVHVADFHEVPGKKTWTWERPQRPNLGHAVERSGWPIRGNSERAVRDAAGYEFLEPRHADTWKEYWYPVNQIGSFVSANRSCSQLQALA
jgi:hypothetical protein